MSISKLVVNHTEKNYFDDYDEIRSDYTTRPNKDTVTRAIEKLARRYRRLCAVDCLLVTNADGSGWRLMYDFGENFDPKTSQRELRLRHYINFATESWDTEERVTVAKAKHKILGR